jgi:hypothetical protein
MNITLKTIRVIEVLHDGKVSYADEFHHVKEWGDLCGITSSPMSAIDYFNDPERLAIDLSNLSLIGDNPMKENHCGFELDSYSVVDIEIETIARIVSTIEGRKPRN